MTVLGYALLLEDGTALLLEDNATALLLEAPAYRDVGIANASVGGDSTDLSTYTVGSFTVALADMVLIFIAHGRDVAVPSDATSVSGTSISGAAKHATIAFDTTTTSRSKLEVWSALGTGSAGTLSINFNGETQNGCIWWVGTLSHVDTSRGSHGVLEVATGRGNTGAFSLSASLTADDLGTRAVAATALNNSVGVTPKAGWTQQSNAANVSPPIDLEVAYSFDLQDMSPTGTAGSGTPTWAMVAVELAAQLAQGTDVAATGASGTGTAANAGAAIKVPAAVAAGTGSAANVGAAIKVAAGVAAGTGLARDVMRITPAATGTGAANDVGLVIAPPAGNAAGTGTASGVKPSVATHAQASTATGAAYGGAGVPSPLVAAGVGVAYFDTEGGSISVELDEGMALVIEGLAFDAVVEIDETLQGNIVTNGAMVLVPV